MFGHFLTSIFRRSISKHSNRGSKHGKSGLASVARRGLRMEPLEERALLSVYVNGYMWNDLNRDGVHQSSYEPGVDGAQLKIYSTTDNVVGNADDVLQGTVTSFSGGWYQSAALPDGLNYYVQMLAPAGFVPETPAVGQGDFDANGLTPIFTGQQGCHNALLVSTAPTWAIQAGTAGGQMSGNAVARDTAGNTYVTGYFSGAVDFDPTVNQCILDSDTQHAFVAKYAADGSLVWATDLSPLSATEGVDVAVSDRGFVYVTGNYSDGSDGGFFVTQISSAGLVAWSKTIALPGYQSGVANRDTVTSVTIPSGSRGAVVAGSFSGTVDFDAGSGQYNLTSAGDQDAFVLQMDSSGNFIWAMRQGGTGYDAASDVAYIGAGGFGGGYYVAGIADNACTLSRLDYTGALQSVKTTSGPGTAIPTAIALSENGTPYVVGYFQGTVDFNSLIERTENRYPGVVITYDDFTLTSDPDANYSVFALSASGSGWARMAGQSDVAPAVDIQFPSNSSQMGAFVNNLCISYLSVLRSSPAGDDYVSRYILEEVDTAGNAEWATTALASASASSPWSAAGRFSGGLALSNDGTASLTGSFIGTATIGNAGQSVTSLGSQDMFLAQLSPYIQAITDFQLDSLTLDCQQPAGILIGQFSQNDPAGSTFQYSLVSGDRDSDNGCFAIDGDQLRTTSLFRVTGTSQYDIRVRVTDDKGQWTESSFTINATDHTSPSVTIARAAGQEAVTDSTPIHFTITFSEPVVDFTTNNVVVGGTAPNAFAERVVRVNGSSSIYELVISGMCGPGTVTVSIPAGSIHDRAGNTNLASTETDNSVQYTATQTFTIAACLPAVAYGNVTWGDYDNDGLLDVLLAGGQGGASPSAAVYHNDGNGAFHAISVGLAPVTSASGAWGDYDNDGRLDILLTGLTVNGDGTSTPIAKVYHNDGNGVFHEIVAGLPGVSGGDVSWADYDGDERLDILLTGSDAEGHSPIRIYHNDGNGTFHRITTGPADSIESPNAYWGDYDNDGQLDLLVCRGVETKLYHNDGNGIFSDVVLDLALPGIEMHGFTWGDYDNDGRLDILASGERRQDYSEHVYVFHNDGSNGFQAVAIDSIDTMSRMDLTWGDYDHDGRMDILANSVFSMNLYHNDGDGSFHLVSIDLPGTYVGSADWGDYDGDGRLDILVCGLDYDLQGFTRIYRNNAAVEPPATQGRASVATVQGNAFGALTALSSATSAEETIAADTPPSAPTNLSAQRLSTTSARLLWQAAVDPETPADGLSYVLRVGTTPGGCDVVNPASNVDGIRQLAERGTIQGTKWTLNGLTPGQTYYWSVQAVDTSFVGSAFADERSFTVGGAPATFQLTSPVATKVARGSDVTIRWNSANVAAGSKISLCYDEDKIWWNGNEHWIEIDQISAANGAGSYTWNTAGVRPGTYYVAGYLWSGGQPTFSHLTQVITIEAVSPTFTLTGPSSGTYTVGQAVPITWASSNVAAGNKISLCYDEDKVWWNGNEHWIEIDQVAASNGNRSYSWNTSGMQPGTYYVAGYLWDGASPTFSRMSQAIRVVAGTPRFELTGPASGSFVSGDPISIAWTAGNVKAGSKISLCYDEDAQWNGNEHWIEIDQVAASNGAGHYTWSTTGLATGTYYIGAYLWDGANGFYTSRLSSEVSVSAVAFSFTTPAESSPHIGDTVGIHWTLENALAGSKISLCYDEDAQWNGNEHWIEIDQVAAVNGSGSYNWDTTGVAEGYYRIAGYVWDGGNRFTVAHSENTIHLHPLGDPQFALSKVMPNSKFYAVASSVEINWTADDVRPGSTISLCYDVDTTLNGNEHWIAVDQIAATNGNGTYTWDTTGIAPGKYYINGYLRTDADTVTNSTLVLGPVNIGAYLTLDHGTETLPTSLPTDAVFSNADGIAALVDAVIHRLGYAGHRFDDLEIEVSDLPGDTLAQCIGNKVYIDRDAAGYGWFVDGTPLSDEEFDYDTVNTTTLLHPALSEGPAAGRVDALTAISFELASILRMDGPVGFSVSPQTVLALSGRSTYAPMIVSLDDVSYT